MLQAITASVFFLVSCGIVFMASYTLLSWLLALIYLADYVEEYARYKANLWRAQRKYLQTVLKGRE